MTQYYHVWLDIVSNEKWNGAECANWWLDTKYFMVTADSAESAIALVLRFNHFGDWLEIHPRAEACEDENWINRDISEAQRYCRLNNPLYESNDL